MEKIRFTKRPLSWSQIASFEYSPEQWYKRYILNERQEQNKEMVFGKAFADSCEKRKPLAPVKIYSKIEYPLKVSFDGIPLVGFIDSYEPHTHLAEFKTGKKAWDQKRANEHGQLDMYLLMLYITHKIKPQDITCHLQWIPTKENGDFSLDFVKPIEVHTFEVKKTMSDILKFGQKIRQTVVSMEAYLQSYIRSSIIPTS